MSSKTRVALGRAALLALAWSALSHLRLGLPDFGSAAQAAGVVAPGGFVEKSNSTAVRTRLSAAQISAMLPARGGFAFPAPYNTEAARLTNSADCNGGDCVNSVGYSYWNNMNNSAGSNTLLAFVVLNRSRGGGGPTLFRYDKTTGEVQKLGPIFDTTSPYANGSGEGWYFSAALPNALYVFRGMTLQRYDVMTRTLTTVFDASAQFGAGTYVWQLHSSHDDRVHSGTLRTSSGSTPLGCFVYREDTRIYKWYPKIGAFDECQVDASGRWLLIKEDLDGLYGEDDRIIDLETGVERRHYDQNGAPGHSDNGYGYAVASDNWNGLPNAIRVFPFDQDSWAQAPVVYNNMDWNVFTPAHVSHANARPGTPLSQQYACGSGANRSNTNRANEILCFRLDSTLDVLVVAPVMTDLDATGGQDGDDYFQQPKGNLDPTGRFFLWTTNMGGPRQDAFVVRVPSQLLVAGGTVADVLPPSVTAIQAGADPTSANIAWATNEPADSQVDYGPSTTYGSTTVRSAAMVTSHAQGLTGLLSGTQYHFRVRSRDAAGNLSLSADQVFTTSTNAPAAGPSAWWRLDEGAGNAFADATGAGHSGFLVNGPARIAGRTGLAVAFDGLDDLATVPHEASLDAYPLSTSFWMKTGATGLTALVNKYAAASRNGWQVFTNGGSLCAWYFRNATNYVWDGGGCTMAVAGVNDNQWHHVAFVVDAGGGRLYVDGALRASRGWTGTPGPATTTQPLTFASYPGTAGPPLAGALDEVRIYARPLGTSEIAALAEGPAPDLKAPVISQMTARVLLPAGAILVSWQTDEPSDAKLEYGQTTGYGSATSLLTTPIIAHTVILPGLFPGRKYHCRAISRDVAGNTTISADYTFMTPAAGATTASDQVTQQPVETGAVPAPSSSM